MQSRKLKKPLKADRDDIILLKELLNHFNNMAANSSNYNGRFTVSGIRYILSDLNAAMDLYIGNVRYIYSAYKYFLELLAVFEINKLHIEDPLQELIVKTLNTCQKYSCLDPALPNRRMIKFTAMYADHLSFIAEYSAAMQHTL